MDEIEAVSGVLGAFAHARSRLYDLFVQLSPDGKPTLDVKIHAAPGNGATSYTVAHVAAILPDGRGVVWSVSLLAGTELRVQGEVEVEAENGGYDSLFHRSEVSRGAAHAAQLIRELTEEVATKAGVFGDLSE